MTGTVWTKFFWQDWLSDASLRRCSPAARGLWMDMLCIAAQHDPIGYLCVKGEALGPSDIARMCGVSEKEASTLTAELERNGVFSRDRQNRIYSRRMVRDAKRSKTAQQNGKIGGNPSLCKDKGILASDNPPLKPPDKPHKPEAKSQELEQPSKQTLHQASEAGMPLERLLSVLKLDHRALQRKPQFQQFPAMFREWRAAGCDAERDIWPTIQRVAARDQDFSSPRFFEKAIFKARDDRVAAEPTERERWQTRLAGFKASGFWPEAPPPVGYGPKPGEPGCLCPPDLLLDVAA